MARLTISQLLLVLTIGLLVGGMPQGTAAHGKPTSISCGGYTVRQYTVPGADEPERVTIQRGTKPLVTISSFGETELACVDVTGDRQRDLIFQTYSGGAHCCAQVYVYQFIPALRRILMYDAGNAGGFEVRSLSGRTVLELGDDTFAYYKDLCYACSPANLPLAACYQDGRFADCTRRYPQLAGRFVTFYTGRLTDAMTFTDESRQAYMRGAALGIYAAYALMGREAEGVPAVRRLTTEAAVLTWLGAQRPAVAKWLTSRAGYLKP